MDDYTMYDPPWAFYETILKTKLIIVPATEESLRLALGKKKELQDNNVKKVVFVDIWSYDTRSHVVFVAKNAQSKDVGIVLLEVENKLGMSTVLIELNKEIRIDYDLSSSSIIPRCTKTTISADS